MAKFAANPRDTAFPTPAYSGTGELGLRLDEWSVANTGAEDGDIISIDIDRVPDAPLGFNVTNYEACVSQVGGIADVSRVLGGPYADYTRRKQVATPNVLTQVQVRAVYQRANEFKWVIPTADYNIVIGDEIDQPTTGMFAKVLSRVNNGGGNWTLTLQDVEGDNDWGVGQNLIVDRGKTASVISSASRTQLNVTLYPEYTPQIGDTVTQEFSGATGTIGALAIIGGTVTVTLGQDGTGALLDGYITTINTTPGVQLSGVYNTVDDSLREIVRSEWSLPKTVTPAAGAKSVTIAASKTDVIQGEAVFLSAEAFGFQTTRPIHELRYRFYVDKAGENGPYASLPESFEDTFGAGSNERSEGFTQVWAFAPKTTGTVTVYCEVTDTAGTSATGQIDLTVQAATDFFAPSQIYAVSPTLRAVPGAPGANIYATFAEMDTALQALNGFVLTRGMILIDTTAGTVGDNFTDLKLQDYFSDTFAIFPYNASGVGPAAGARATITRALKLRSQNFILYGVNLEGPFDPPDPFSVSSAPIGALNNSEVGHSGVSESRITGWGVTVALPNNFLFRGEDIDYKAAYTGLEVTDFHNFGFFGDDVGQHALAGCFTWTNPQSWRFGGKGDTAGEGFFVDHGPYRASRPREKRGFSKCVFFSCCSWGGYGEPQPPIRFFGSGQTRRPEVFHGAQVLTEGGKMTIDATTRGGGDTTTHPQDIVYDRWKHITSMQPGEAFNVGFGGVTIRNGVLATSANEARLNSNGVVSHFKFSNKSSVPGQHDNENQPIVIANCSVIDLRIDANQGTKSLTLFSNDSNYPMKDVTFINTMTYAPDFTLSDDGAEPLATTPQFTPLYAGEYFWMTASSGNLPAGYSPIAGFNAMTNAEKLAAQTPRTEYATSNPVTATFEPASGSNAYRTATAPIPVDDIRGRIRNQAQASKGAYDPDAV